MTVKPLNLTLYLVLDPDLCSQSVGIVETALAAVQAGAGIVQLRAPTWKKAPYDGMRSLTQICAYTFPCAAHH